MIELHNIPRTLENGDINPELKAAQLAAYYEGRAAYDPLDPRKMIGRYSPTGEVIKFASYSNR